MPSAISVNISWSQKRFNVMFTSTGTKSIVKTNPLLFSLLVGTHSLSSHQIFPSALSLLSEISGNFLFFTYGKVCIKSLHILQWLNKATRPIKHSMVEPSPLPKPVSDFKFPRIRWETRKFNCTIKTVFKCGNRKMVLYIYCTSGSFRKSLLMSSP